MAGLDIWECQQENFKWILPYFFNFQNANFQSSGIEMSILILLIPMKTEKQTGAMCYIFCIDENPR